MAPNTLTPQQIGDAIRSFRSRNCPACGAEKVSREVPFCTECLDRLPAELHARVMDRDKYIGAFHAALEHLRTGAIKEVNGFDH
jgi:hypothetical protein